MNGQTLLLNSLDIRWDGYKAGLKKCRNQFSVEAIHDFRVAVRRLLALLDLLHALVRDAKIKKIRRTLKGQLDSLDELRDTQVMRADIHDNIQKVPLLEPFEKYLGHREKKLMRAARKEIESLNAARADLSRRIRKLEKAIAESQPDGLNPLSAVDEAYANVIQRWEQVDPARPATIHRLRIAFKRFRYMVEAIQPVLEGAPSNHLKKMQAYQTSMGVIQDMEVALQNFTKFEKYAPADCNAEFVRSYYKERHALAISRYIEGRSKVFTFWRPAPDQPFSKET